MILQTLFFSYMIDTSVPSLSIDIHISQKIKERRQFLNLTQKGIAGQLNISIQQLQKYENGQNKVSASKLIELSKILKFNIADLFKNYETHNKSTLKESSVFSEDNQNQDFQSEAIKLFTSIKCIETQTIAINMLKMLILENTN